jgi:membrane-associated protease RseP (regulator of RpoE activity)
MSIFVLSVIVLVLILILIGIKIVRIIKRRAYLREHQYVGFGFVLGWKDEVVSVVTLLLKSEAYLAGVRRGDKIHSCNGVPFNFETPEEFNLWFTEHRPTLGEDRECIL